MTHEEQIRRYARDVECGLWPDTDDGWWKCDIGAVIRESALTLLRLGATKNDPHLFLLRMIAAIREEYGE